MLYEYSRAARIHMRKLECKSSSVEFSVKNNMKLISSDVNTW